MAGDLFINSVGTLLINVIAARVFDLRTQGDILDANGQAANLFGGLSSFLSAVGIIGTDVDPIEVSIAEGDLTVFSDGQRNGVSVSLAGSIPGDLIFNLTPGLVVFNALQLGGSPKNVLNSGLAAGFNLVDAFRTRNYSNDLRTIAGMQYGYGLSRRYERDPVPVIDMRALDRMPRVLVNLEEQKKWLRRVLRPVVEPVASRRLAGLFAFSGTYSE